MESPDQSREKRRWQKLLEGEGSAARGSEAEEVHASRDDGPLGAQGTRASAGAESQGGRKDAVVVGPAWLGGGAKVAAGVDNVGSVAKGIDC